MCPQLLSSTVFLKATVVCVLRMYFLNMWCDLMCETDGTLQAAQKSSIGRTSWKLTSLRMPARSHMLVRRVDATSLVGHICVHMSGFMLRALGSGVSGVTRALSDQVLWSSTNALAARRRRQDQDSVTSGGELVVHARTRCHTLTRLSVQLLEWRHVCTIVKESSTTWKCTEVTELESN